MANDLFRKTQAPVGGFVSSYQGTCAVCQGQYYAGDRIEGHADAYLYSYRHVQCDPFLNLPWKPGEIGRLLPPGSADVKFKQELMGSFSLGAEEAKKARKEMLKSSYLGKITGPKSRTPSVKPIQGTFSGRFVSEGLPKAAELTGFGDAGTRAAQALADLMNTPVGSSLRMASSKNPPKKQWTCTECYLQIEVGETTVMTDDGLAHIKCIDAEGAAEKLTAVGRRKIIED